VFVAHLAARGYDVVTVARDAQRLDAQAADLGARFGVSIEPAPTDLASDAGIRALEARLRDGPFVDLLVNNAGLSTGKPFLDGDIEDEDAALSVMVRSVMRLSHAAALRMRAEGRGQVLNVSSIAGWLPGGTYSAAKAWVTTFTDGLADELAGSGATATALCPGFVRTEFHERAGLDMRNVPDIAWCDADDVVAAGLRDAFAGRRVSVPGALYKAARVGVAIAPAPLLRRAVRKSPGRGPR
jgi:short-subunit dehydrogenase